VSGRIGFDPRSRRERPWLPALTVPGRIYIGPTGEVLRAHHGGGVDRVVLGGRPHGGIAEDASAGGREGAGSAPGAGREAGEAVDSIQERLRRLREKHPPPLLPAPLEGAPRPPRAWSDTDEDEETDR
jgi:hypothetical protein